MFYNYFKDILENRKQSLISKNTPAFPSNVDWKRFPTVLGKPVTGKSFAIQQCIAFSIQNNLMISVATPTGTLACTCKEVYGDEAT